MKTALYFGSFNPVHRGHTALAQYILEYALAEELWFVVSPMNPLKSPEGMIDESFRYQMLQLATADQPKFKVSDIEFKMPIPSYTIDSLDVIKRRYPEREFVLLIGSDNALVFNQWKDYKRLLAETKILVYPRSGFDFESVRKVYPEMNLLNTPMIDISSTEIRALIHKKKDVSDWLHPLVINYIAENQIYK